MLCKLTLVVLASEGCLRDPGRAGRQTHDALAGSLDPNPPSMVGRRGAAVVRSRCQCPSS